MSESKAERNVREFVEHANDVGNVDARSEMSKRDYIREHATKIVDDVLDGWDFEAWTVEERERMLDELATAVIEAAPTIAHELALRKRRQP